MHFMRKESFLTLPISGPSEVALTPWKTTIFVSLLADNVEKKTSVVAVNETEMNRLVCLEE